MSLLQLTALSIGATLGTGIFVILGEAVPLAGPAIVLSFVLAAVTTLFSALSYAELAGSIPVPGSSYSCTYATMGELVAWVCGWCLVLGYGVSVAAVAVGWGAYIDDLAASTVGAVLPEVLSAPPGDGGVSNVPAVVVVLLAMGLLLLRGTSESARVNTAMVVLRVGVLLFFCGVAVTAFRAGNLAPFVPMGVAGVTAAASLLVCYDVAFPEAVRAHAVAGTGLLVVPTGPMDPYGHVGTVLVPARAYESQLFVAYTNRTGAEGEFVYCGAGCVIAPDGTELARAGRGEELLLAEGAPAVLTASPRVDPHLADRRPELYPTETPA